MILHDLTVIVLTYNEAPNLRRTLEALEWAQEIVVVDSYSTDNTEGIAKGFPDVAFVRRAFDSHAAQWNFGLEQARTEWVLSLDADYVLTKELVDELTRLRPAPATSAYFAKFHYCIAGHRLRGNLYPPRAVLFRRARCRYVQDGHTQRLHVEGATQLLRGCILHDDRKPLSRWLDSQRTYAQLEADHLLARDPKTLRWPDRLRYWIWPAAPAAFVYTLIFKGCLFDGWPGWFYVMQRTYAELLLSLELLDRRLRDIGS